MNKTSQLFRGGELEYSTPALDIIDMRIEKGFADSDPYGQEGGAGDELGTGNDYEF